MQIVKMQFGSHVYGTNTETSDLDFKGVYLPESSDILLGRIKPSITQNTKTDQTQRNEAGDTDFENFSIQKFLQLLCEGQTVAMDMIFTPERFYIEPAQPAWIEIKENKHRFISAKSASFVGYCRTQANKYGIKGSRIAAVRKAIEVLTELPQQEKLKDNWKVLNICFRDIQHIAFVECPGPNSQTMPHLEVCDRKVPDHALVKYARELFQKILDNYGHRALLAEKHEGIDWKALMHAVRVAKEAQELLLTGHVTQPRPERELLLKIRKAQLPYKEVAEIIEQGLIDVEECEKKSTLRKEPDWNFADLLVLRYHSRMVITL